LCLVTCDLVPQVSPVPEPFARSLEAFVHPGREAQGAQTVHATWFNSRMVVISVVEELLPPPAMIPPHPPGVRVIAQCATREVVAWLLESAIATGCGEHWRDCVLVTCDLCGLDL
jgi:hypothetical protein